MLFAGPAIIELKNSAVIVFTESIGKEKGVPV